MTSRPSWPLALAFALALSACQCGKSPAKPTLLNEGDPCETDEACSTSLCEAPPGRGKVCVRQCGNGCRTGEVCEQLTPNRFSCMPEKAGLCMACNTDADCPYPADRCLLVNGVEKVCGRDCAFDQKCPTSYRCVNAVASDGSPRPQQCVPQSGTCACTAATVGQTVTCEVQNSIGRCAGKRTCDGLQGYSACDARTPVQETCNGLDDDCDGQNDEDLGQQTCGVGECRRTVAACVAGQPLACTAGTPTTEVCNGKDDDCDGTVDNGFSLQTSVTHCGTCNNACQLPNATPKCSGGTCQVDTCNQGYGNCDGQHPNGCEATLATDVDHCNACNNSCRRPNTVPSCTAGQCSFTCLTGYWDLDQDPANGCEYQCNRTSNTDLPDLNFTDANCDGIDGEVGNGIFVATSGSDANPGTRQLPKQTLAEGLATAVTDGKRDVYVAQGTYFEQLAVNQVTGKTIAGGYEAARWQRSNLNTVAVAGSSPAVRLTQANNTRLQLLTFQGANMNGASETAYGAWIASSTGVALEGLTIIAGNAGDGLDGGAVSPGAGGADGGVGERGCTYDPDMGSLFCSQCSRPGAGAAGASSCGAAGGQGGPSGYATYGNTGSTGGNGVTAPSGGTGGLGVPAQEANWSPPPYTYNGVNGTDGNPGNDGTGGTGLGSLTVAGYLPSVAGNGFTGSAGRGGGGGGGGGGGCNNSLFGIFCVCWSYGSTGGGGGAGGCGGPGGNAGKSGGASIGVLLWSSSVNATQVSVRTGRGGKGGNGTNGGAGGQGGQGAPSSYDVGNQGDASKGGTGGRGGTGGAGGKGGGGGGGPVVGIARNSTASWTSSTTTYQLGTPGAGGTSPSSAPTAQGQAGTSASIQVF